LLSSQPRGNDHENQNNCIIKPAISSFIFL
jgi:hypothetical protein